MIMHREVTMNQTSKSDPRVCVIGMDLGSTNAKAVLLAEDGSVLCKVSAASNIISDHDGWMEQDADVCWESIRNLIRELVIKSEVSAEQIKGICISSHTVSLLPLDREGKPLRRLITYQDRRAGKEIREILEKVGKNRYISIVGGQPAVAFLPGKLLWMKRHEPEIYDKTESLVQLSSYINFKLSGVLVSDLDQAVRTQCMDAELMEWSPEIAEAMEIPVDKLMPAVVSPNEVIGEVTSEAASLTGLAAGTKVLAGCSDALAAMYATGMSEFGEAGESSGTSSLLFVGAKNASLPDLPVTTKPCTIDGMPWIYDAPITTTGAAIKWYIDEMADREKAQAQEKGVDIYTYLNELALEAAPGSGGLLFYPYLLGERAPLWNNYAKAMFIGMSMQTTREEMARSVFEGTAYCLRHVMECAREGGGDAGLLRVCGGGTKSRTWSMIKASVLNMPVYVMDEECGDVPVGDAILAARSLGIFDSDEEASRKTLRVKEVLEPDPEWVKVYDALYPCWKEMYQQLDKSMEKLQKARHAVTAVN